MPKEIHRLIPYLERLASSPDPTTSRLAAQAASSLDALLRHGGLPPIPKSPEPADPLTHLPNA